MYGTVAHLKVKPGHDQKLKEFSEGAGSEPIAGAVASYVYRLAEASDAYVLAAVFEDEASYRANASS